MSPACVVTEDGRLSCKKQEAGSKAVKLLKDFSSLRVIELFLDSYPQCWAHEEAILTLHNGGLS